MAKTNKNRLIGKWNALIEEQKEAYKESKGFKIARGWKESEQYKDLERRKKRAIYRQGYRQRKKYFKQQDVKPPPITPARNEVVYSNGDIHHKVLSYGGKFSRDLIDDIAQQRKASRSAQVGAYVDGKLIGTAGSEQGVNNLFKVLYEKANQMQDKTGSYVLVYSTGRFFPDQNIWRTVVEIRSEPYGDEE